MRLAIAYDFRKAFLRLSTLVLLVAFIAIGVTLSYVSYLLIVRVQPADSIALYATRGNECIVVGAVFDRRGSLINGRIALAREGKTIYTTASRNGVYIASDPSLCTGPPEAIEIETGLGKFNITKNPISANVPFAVYGYPHGFIYHNNTLILFRLFVLSRRTGNAILITVGSNISSNNFKPNLKLNYTTIAQGNRVTQPRIVNEVASRRSLCTETSSTPYGCRSLEVSDLVEVHKVVLSPYDNILVFELADRDRLTYSTINYRAITTLEQQYLSVALGSQGIELFAMFFPIVMMNLANVVMAKPKDVGALEFLLARPITRFDLYLSRYLAGVLTAVTSSALFVASTALSSKMFIGVSLDITDYITLYLGLTLSFVMFYTLFYALASSVRSGIYLGLAIAIYAFLAFLWDVITYIMITTAFGTPLFGKEFLELYYALSYLSPRGFTRIFQYFVMLNYGLTPEVAIASPHLCATVFVVWTSIFFGIGYKVFRKKTF